MIKYTILDVSLIYTSPVSMRLQSANGSSTLQPCMQNCFLFEFSRFGLSDNPLSSGLPENLTSRIASRSTLLYNIL